MRKPFKAGPNGTKLINKLLDLSPEEQQRVGIAGLVRMANEAIEFFTSIKDGAEEDVKSLDSSFPDVMRAAAAIANKAPGPLMGSFVRGVLIAAGIDIEETKAALQADVEAETEAEEGESKTAFDPALAMQAQREMDRLIKIFKGESPTS